MIIQASAQCEIYRVSMGIFDLPFKITNNFWQGFKKSVKDNDWRDFISQFGTHFVYEASYGGRGAQQITISEKNLTKLKEL